jgi:hypothetical protein
MRLAYSPPPTKPIYTSQLARAVGLSIYTIRRMDRCGLLRSARDYKNWRVFPPSEIERVRELLGWRVLDALETEPPEANSDPDTTAEDPRPQ